jgi:cholesterol transport system auxiliary component
MITNCNREEDVRTTTLNLRRNFRTAFALLLSLGYLAGCGSLLPKAPTQPTLYVLEGTPRTQATNAVALSVTSVASAITITVTTPIAAPGFGSTHIVYQRQTHELEHFALNQWVDTPAQMLTPLIVSALEKSGAFRAVVRGSTAAASELRLDTELVRLQQEFMSIPSRARVTLRAVLVDTTTRRVIGSREFDVEVAAKTDDPMGGVAAANEAVQRLLIDLAGFCAEAARR